MSCRRWFAFLIGLSALCFNADRASAVGWTSTDFLITGATNFPDRIGVFDKNFGFKGYVDQNFLGVQGLGFDTQGRLVATSNLMSEVRVYDSSGAKVGGFTQSTSPMLSTASAVTFAPNGDYILGTLTNGAREFTPDGTFVRQFGNGNSTGAAMVPGNRLWTGGTSTFVTIYDYTSGL